MNPLGACRPRRGLTLAETIVVIFVFSLLALTITQLLRGGVRAWQRGNTRMKLRSDARAAIDQIQADFRQCSANSTGLITPSSSTTKSSTLQFSRYDTPGTTTTTTVTYTINSATRTLTRQEGSGSAIVLAENVVDTDPRDNVQKSYFAWENADLKVMGIHLYLVEDATLKLTAAAPTTLETVWLHSGAYWAGQGPIDSAAETKRAPITLKTPTSLIDPRTSLSAPAWR